MMFLCLSWRNILISLTAVIGKPSFSFSRRTFTINHLNDLEIKSKQCSMGHVEDLTFLRAKSSPFSIIISGGGVALYTSP